MEPHTAPTGVTIHTLGVYDETGRYLGPAPVAIRFYPADPRDARQLQEAA